MSNRHQIFQLLRIMWVLSFEMVGCSRWLMYPKQNSQDSSGIATGKRPSDMTRLFRVGFRECMRIPDVDFVMEW